MQEFSRDIALKHPDDVLSLFGTNERHLKLMEQELSVTIHARTEVVQVLGEETAVELARLVIEALLVLVGRGMMVATPYILDLANKGFAKAIREDAGLREGVTTYQGHITSQPVADGLEREYTAIEAHI